MTNPYRIEDLSRECIVKLYQAITEFNNRYEETEHPRIVASAVVSSLFNLIVEISFSLGLTPQQMQEALTNCVAHSMGAGETKQ